MTEMPVIKFDNYLMRPVKTTDAIDYYDIGKDKKTVKFLSWEAFNNIEEAFIHFDYIYFSEDYINDPGGYAIVDVITNKMIGVIDFHTYNRFLKTAHIGYLLHRDYWNLGITTKALKEIIKVGFEHLDLRKIYIKSIKENYSSRRVCEKNDFKLLKINKRSYYHEKTKSYHDVYKYVFERKRYYDTKTKRDL